MSKMGNSIFISGVSIIYSTIYIIPHNCLLVKLTGNCERLSVPRVQGKKCCKKFIKSIDRKRDTCYNIFIET